MEFAYLTMLVPTISVIIKLVDLSLMAFKQTITLKVASRI